VWAALDQRIIDSAVAHWCQHSGKVLRRRHSGGDGVPVNFGLRRRTAGPKKSVPSAQCCNVANFVSKIFSKEHTL